MFRRMSVFQWMDSYTVFGINLINYLVYKKVVQYICQLHEYQPFSLSDP